VIKHLRSKSSWYRNTALFFCMHPRKWPTDVELRLNDMLLLLQMADCCAVSNMWNLAASCVVCTIFTSNLLIWILKI
jgi:hypothetical protein